MRHESIWGLVSLLVAACGHGFPGGAGGAAGAAGAAGTGGQDASPPPPACVSVAGRYLASYRDASYRDVMDQPVDVQQTGCAVSAVVPGFGSVACTAQAPGVAPRLAACTLHVDACPRNPTFSPSVADDERAFRFSATTRGGTCTGTSSGGTVIFSLTLAPFYPAARPLPEPTLPVNVTFAGLTEDGAPVSTYVENGVTITTASATWVAESGYGNPAPSLQFESPAGVGTRGEITITAGGPFSFSSLDVSASNPRTAFLIEGTLGSDSVLWMNDAAETGADFVTIENPRPSITIDKLVIRLSNENPPCCPSPLIVDNIIIRRSDE